MEQERQERGRFAAKGNSPRVFRGIRLTDATWAALGEKADNEDMTRADYLEALAASEVSWDFEDAEADQPELDFDLDEVADLLKQALKLKANAGGKIKTKIREALELMGIDSEDE